MATQGGLRLNQMWSRSRESEKNDRLRKKYKFYLKWLYLMQLTIKLFLASFITKNIIVSRNKYDY